MNLEMVETWRYLRDHGKPISERDAADYAKIRDFTPPTRKMLKRIARAQVGKDGRIENAPREYPPLTPELIQKQKQLDFHKRVISALGGSLTVASPTHPPRPFVHYVHQHGPIEQQSERDRQQSEARRLQREHIRDMGRMLYTDFQPDMFTVLDAYGSFNAYCKDALRA